MGNFEICQSIGNQVHSTKAHKKSGGQTELHGLSKTLSIPLFSEPSLFFFPQIQLSITLITTFLNAQFYSLSLFGMFQFLIFDFFIFVFVGFDYVVPIHFLPLLYLPLFFWKYYLMKAKVEVVDILISLWTVVHYFVHFFQPNHSHYVYETAFTFDEKFHLIAHLLYVWKYKDHVARNNLIIFFALYLSLSVSKQYLNSTPIAYLDYWTGGNLFGKFPL